MKSFKDLSKNITDEEYRSMDLISYSMLSAYNREGPQAIKKYLDHDTDTDRYLERGALMDRIVFEGPVYIRKNFSFLADCDMPGDKLKSIADSIHNAFPGKALDSIPKQVIVAAANMHDYQTNWKDDTRVDKIVKSAGKYYSLLTEGKKILSVDQYESLLRASEILLDSPVYPRCSNNGETEMFTQLKFIANVKYVGEYKFMPDLIIVNHIRKTIKIYDLKTTGKWEEYFPDSVTRYGYYIQACMYVQGLKSIIEKDPDFREYTVDPVFSFITINTSSPGPIQWDFRMSLNTNGFVDDKGTVYKGWVRLYRECQWHISTGIFNYSYDTYVNNYRREITNINVI